MIAYLLEHPTEKSRTVAQRFGYADVAVRKERSRLGLTRGGAHGERTADVREQVMATKDLSAIEAAKRLGLSRSHVHRVRRELGLVKVVE